MPDIERDRARAELAGLLLDRYLRVECEEPAHTAYVISEGLAYPTPSLIKLMKRLGWKYEGDK